MLDTITRGMSLSFSIMPVRLPAASPILPNINPNPATYNIFSFVREISENNTTRNIARNPNKQYPRIHRTILMPTSPDKAIIANGKNKAARQLTAQYYLLRSPTIPASIKPIEDSNPKTVSYLFLYVITIPKTEAKNAIGASLTNTNSNPCKIVPATANSGSLKFQFI